MKKIFVCIVAALFFTACSADKSLFQKARLATSKGDFPQAIDLYNRVIKQNPKNFAAFLNRGVLWERLPAKNRQERYKNRRNAEKDYLRALEINPYSAEAHNNLGALYIDIGRYMEAIFQLNDALSLQPNYFTARMNRAIAHYRTGNVTGALTDFNRAAAQRPKDPLLLLNRALAFYDMGQYESSAKDLSMLIAANPDHARAYLERARAFIKLGYPSEAYSDLEKAVSIKPTYSLAYYYMGDLMFRKGETELALGLLVRSKELANQYAPTYELMGDMLAVQDPVAATSNYMVARKLDPANARRYNAKIESMKTDKGRERVQAARFFPR